MATNISRALLLSATANTATPFLYQTRTLTPVLRSFQRSCAPRLQHSYSTKTDGSETNYETEANESTEEHNTQAPANNQPRKSYLRRRGPLGSRDSDSPAKFKSVTSREKATFSRLLNQFRADLTADDVVAQSTAERNAKQNDVAELMKLFGEIINNATQQKAKPNQQSIPTHDEQDSKRRNDVSSEGPLPKETGEAEEMSLDGAIYTREELGLQLPKSGVDHNISMAQAIALVVQRETFAIENALFEAIEGNKGDMAVWEVCKTRIFSMLHHMDGQTSAEPSILDGNGADSSTTTASNHAVVIPPMIPAGMVITTLYPRALLTAFRLLNTHFPESQLISQFRASIKAQGRTSALLGASPELYHEMVHFYWHGCRDLPAVVAFLHDMDVHGLHAPRETIALLRGIERQGKTQTKSSTGAREGVKGSSPFWDLPPNQKALAELSENGGWLETFKSQKTTRRERDTREIPLRRRAY